MFLKQPPSQYEYAAPTPLAPYRTQAVAGAGCGARMGRAIWRMKYSSPAVYIVMATVVIGFAVAGFIGPRQQRYPHRYRHVVHIPTLSERLVNAGKGFLAGLVLVSIILALVAIVQRMTFVRRWQRLAPDGTRLTAEFAPDRVTLWLGEVYRTVPRSEIARCRAVNGHLVIATRVLAFAIPPELVGPNLPDALRPTASKSPWRLW